MIYWRVCFRVTLLCAAVGALAWPGLSRAQELKKFTSRWYEIHTDLSREEAKEYARHMDLVYSEYRSRFRNFKTRNSGKAALYLFAHRADYISFLAKQGIDATNSGGMFAYRSRPRFHGLLTYLDDHRHEEAISTLQHEGFHQFAWTYLGYELPPWANEGIAQYFEDGILASGKMHLGLVNSVRLAEVKSALAQSPPPVTFEELIEIDRQTWSVTLRQNPRKAGVLYAYAWSVAHFLVHANNGRYSKAFDAYLKRLANGGSSREAFLRAFGSRNLEPMRKKWEAYVQELEPDPLAEAMLRMRMIAEGMLWMQENGQPMPDDMVGLQKVLSQRRYRWGYKVPGLTIRVEAADPESFGYRGASGELDPFVMEPSGPPVDSRGRPIPGAEAPPLPRVLAPGLKPSPSIRWRVGDDGALSYRVVFE